MDHPCTHIDCAMAYCSGHRCNKPLCLETFYGDVALCNSCLEDCVQKIKCDKCEKIIGRYTGSFKYVEIVLCDDCYINLETPMTDFVILTGEGNQSKSILSELLDNMRQCANTEILSVQNVVRKIKCDKPGCNKKDCYYMEGFPPLGSLPH